jgi:2-hydroxy-3-keto-5-methylthiopentenyl-1-phosphate phosphatase
MFSVLIPGDGIDISLDPGFAEFYDWTLKHNVPVIVLSSGMEPIIRALLAKLIGPKANSIPILSNNVEISPDQSWKIVYRDESRTPPPRKGVKTDSV